MSDKDVERLVAEIDKRLKDRAKADPRSIKDIVEDALKREFSTGATAAIERRIDERKQRIQTLDREINERQRERAEEKDELTRLQKQLENHTGVSEAEIEDARKALDGTPREPTNPAIQKKANNLGLTPQELLDRL